MYSVIILEMPRGGLRPNTKVESNHLFKPKWNNKKTTAIRIPEVFKACLINLARYLDKSENSGLFEDDNYIVYIVEKYNNLEVNYQSICEELEECKKENLQLKNQQKANQNLQKNQQGKYQIAVECFEEFVKDQNLDMEELSKSRKGTKKHQIYLINQWLREQSKSKK